ncbi:vesicle transport through interaction with t-SNAREs-like protein 1A-like [Oopsacas minuta]|uniref:Vesicle transport through interaction with t-SNAREs-like protein 1A-like n=1 Tax=Oopsacas minuta TaxID=111878 RepID=A0AAV7JST9_9METZ|nr:vesicle transport through interaction with t-SNAREs-like protein 1A-like [Oopsacas minuta]
MSLFDNYEQQFATTTTDATIRINRIQDLSGSDKASVVAQVESCLGDAKDLVDQMEITMLECSPELRPDLQKRISTYKVELTRLRKELEKAQKDEREVRFQRTGISTTSDDHKRLVLGNEDILDKSSKHLERGQRIVVQTEEIGLEVMSDLRDQRDTIEHSLDRMKGVSTDLSSSSRILSRMKLRIYQNRFILIIGVIVLACLLVLILFIIIKSRVDQSNK